MEKKSTFYDPRPYCLCQFRKNDRDLVVLCRLKFDLPLVYPFLTDRVPYVVRLYVDLGGYVLGVHCQNLPRLAQIINLFHRQPKVSPNSESLVD